MRVCTYILYLQHRIETTDVQVRLTSARVHEHSDSFRSKPEQCVMLNVTGSESAFRLGLQQGNALLSPLLCLIEENSYM